MENNENRLVPGQSRPPQLAKLKKLAHGPPASGRPAPSSPVVVAPAKPRRFRRAGTTWAGALVLGAVLMTAASLVLLERGGSPGKLLRGAAAPATRIAMPGAAGFLPDAALSPEESGEYWALAEFDPDRFAALLGVRPDEPARMEEDARRLERLLSGRSPGR